MTGLEWNNFEKLNFREYIISENTEYISYYNELKDEGIKSILNFKEIQRLIEKIALFYEFKYPEKMLDDMEHMAISDDQSLYECFQISKRLDIEQLQYRLSHDELQFLECSHGGNLYLHKKKENRVNLAGRFIQIQDDGTVEEQSLSTLEEIGYIQNKEGITTAENLLSYFNRYESDIDYSQLAELVKCHEGYIGLRNKTLDLVSLRLLYSGHPKNGYTRAVQFVKDFNLEYSTGLSMEKLDAIMSIDYSNSDSVKRIIKECGRN